MLDSVEPYIDPIVFKHQLNEIPSNARLGLSINVKFSLVFQGESFGSKHLQEIELADLVPPLNISKPSENAGVALPNIKEPPSFASILSQAPGDTATKPEWFRRQAKDLLSPIGGSYVICNTDIPFSAKDFTQETTFSISSLDKKQSAWLEDIYTLFRKNVQLKQDLIRTTKESNGGSIPQHPSGVPTVIVYAPTGLVADPRTTPDYSLPAWSELGNAKVSPSIEYTLEFPILGCNDELCQNKGYAWSIN